VRNATKTKNREDAKPIGKTGKKASRFRFRIQRRGPGGSRTDVLFGDAEVSKKGVSSRLRPPSNSIDGEVSIKANAFAVEALA